MVAGGLLQVPVVRQARAVSGPGPSPYHKLRRASHHIISGAARPSNLRAARVQELQRQHKQQEEEEPFSVLYCSLFLFLFGCFVLGIVMVVFGVLSVSNCKVRQ